MKEEIKEILEDVKRHLDYVEATGQCSIRDNEMKAMYDYITNLQEEVNKLTAESTEWESKCYDLQEEIERQSKAQVILDNQITEMFKYKQRIEKAVEYIKENCIDDEFYINLTNKEKNIIKVLDILKGDKDE